MIAQYTAMAVKSTPIQGTNTLALIPIPIKEADIYQTDILQKPRIVTQNMTNFLIKEGIWKILQITLHMSIVAIEV